MHYSLIQSIANALPSAGLQQSWYQIPAYVAIASLIIEGLLTFHHISALFQLTPIFVAGIAGYYSWEAGFHLIACLYYAGGVLAILAFASVHIYVNIPAAILFSIITLLPNPEKDKTSVLTTIRFPESLLEICLITAISVVYLGIRFTRPRIFVIASAFFAVLLAYTVSYMLQDVGLPAIQRTASLVAGIATLSASGIYYYFASRHLEYELPRLRSSVAENSEERKRVEAELRAYVLQLDSISLQNRYRPSWVYCLCREAGISETYKALQASGELANAGGTGPAPSQSSTSPFPTRTDGLKTNAPDLLGIPSGATMRDVKDAYQVVIKNFSAEKLAALNPDVQPAAEKMAKAIKIAYQLLIRV